MAAISQKITKRLIPGFVKRTVLHYQQEKRVWDSHQIPCYLLEHKHIQNTKILLDREELLEVLPKGGVVAELGVDEGAFSEQIVSLNKPKKLHLIDPWNSIDYSTQKGELVKRKFQSLINGGMVEICEGFSTDAIKRFEDGHFDWVYIDTDHSYETTAKELVACESKIKPGGFITGHDYAVGNWGRSIRFGVVEAVHEFCVKHNWKITYLTLETHHSRSFAIQRIG